VAGLALAAGLLLLGCVDEPGARERAHGPKDTQPPAWTEAAQLVARDVGRGHLNLQWPAAADDGRVATYRVFVDGRRVAEVQGTSYLVSLLQPDTDYLLVVQAVDAAGNAADEGLVGSLRTKPLRLRRPALPQRGTP
jgi:hypothetical protein